MNRKPAAIRARDGKGDERPFVWNDEQGRRFLFRYGDTCQSLLVGRSAGAAPALNDGEYRRVRDGMVIPVHDHDWRGQSRVEADVEVAPRPACVEVNDDRRWLKILPRNYPDCLPSEP